jgi:transcription-repair coupling factor (superfamily II helicase)
MIPAARHILASGAPEGFDATLVLKELSNGGGAPVLHVARDDKRMAAMARALAFFDPTVAVLFFPGWDCLPYDRVSPNAEISATRMATLAALAGGLSGPFVVLTTLNAASQFVPARAVLQSAAFSASVGARIDEAGLKQFLVRMGFVQTPTVSEPGDYALRGGIIDVWPPGASGPVRLDLFGDVLDGARRFDPATQRTTEKLDRVELAPVSEVILDEAAITRFRQNYRIEFGAAGTRCTKPSAPGASTRAWNIGCRFSMSGWKRCLITCPARRSPWMTRSPPNVWPAGTASPINMTRAKPR